VNLNGDVYSKRIVDVKKIPKKIEVSYLFYLHTHPPYKNPVSSTNGSSRDYGFFSSVDMKGFLTSSSCMTGLVTDRLWVVLKTNDSPKKFDFPEDLRITPEFLIQTFKMRVYSGNLSRILVTYEPAPQARDLVCPGSGIM
jgi:hypothetical protein